MKESSLERDCKKLARMLGWIAFKGDSRNGGADQAFLRDGQGFCVEFKSGDNKQQDNQKNEERVMKEHGIPYFVVRNMEEMREALLYMSPDLKY